VRPFLFFQRGADNHDRVTTRPEARQKALVPPVEKFSGFPGREIG
jgi:hypothetical protein